ncbi:band 4.1-like protein 2 isoform X8 [Oncorhynchus kisutch]|uniref:Erythrocyte membrane protein band 4.1 like 2 n=1 Tax=Oncorhynchus kisutch TaxID=8019 RepID=A0A8C7F883_ONCKI|nr:band 4.1-like protein 2 isoform X8 [Oncorhynchus kisutch]
MTTEVGSETEVKKEPEKTVEQPAEPERPATNQTDEVKVVEAAEQSNESPALATDSAKPKENQEEAQPADNATGPEGEEPPASPPASEKKGISRFLPPWLKRQKSQSVVGPKESQVTPKEEGGVVLVKGEGEGEKAEQAEAEQTSLTTAAEPQVEEEQVNGEAEPEQKEEVNSEEHAENHSTGSAETQPAKEEKASEKSLEKSAAEEEETEGGEEKKDQEERLKPEGGRYFIKSPLKLTKKVKMVMCHVIMLDGSQFPCEVEKRAKGQYLFFKVCEALNLLEKDYFGLSYKDNADQTCWLDPTKEIKHQICNPSWQLAFNVKFYPPDPSQLTEDITRYLLCLQLRQDIVSGRLPCSFVTHSLLGSYSLQAELGDHDPDEQRLDYISDFQFAPSQTKEMEEKVVELHKTHRGMTPAQADTQFLENAKKLSMYGVDLHHAKDSEGVDIMLGVCANGLLIYKDRLRINRFAWPKILKISYKRSNFYIKIRPGETEQFESTVGFKLPNHRSAKRVWKVCVENHTFFRLMTPEAPTKAKFLTLGSKFRYSGRTQAQTRQASTLIDRPAPYFERTSSKRISRSLDGAPVINMIEAQDSAPTSVGNGREPGLELSSDSSKISDDKQKSNETTLQAAEVEIDEMVVVEEIRVAPKGSVTITTPEVVVTPVAVETELEKPEEEVIEEVKEEQKRPVSVSSESESEEEAGEYHPQVTVSTSVEQIKEEPEEEEKEEVDENEEPEQVAEPEPLPEVEVETMPSPAVVEETPMAEPETALVVDAPAEEERTEDILVTPEEAPNGHAEDQPGLVAVEEEEEEEEEPRVNGDASHAETERIPQVICCSEPPVVKTEMVTISDTFAAQKTEIATKEVPIVHTETKTITYEAAQLDGSGDGEPGILMTAQTITSESLCTTTTTHITKTLKGGLSETRIEKRIVITGDSDIDHDQALAQAIKEAKEQHPDMSVTRVVVHKETELAEEGED